jgi:hypothetical protein
LIQGYFDGETPRIQALVSVPRSGLPALPVEFMLDTGAAFTLIGNAALGSIGAYIAAADYVREISAGAGDRLEVKRVRTLLEFEQVDAEPLRLTVFVRVPVIDMPPEVPPVLGMDIISMFRLTVSVPERRVDLESVPRSPR